MGQIHLPQPVKCVCSILGQPDAPLAEAEARLADMLGEVDYRSDLLPFDHTRYYEGEHGLGLVRRIVAFRPLVYPGGLAAIKLQTNEMERLWAHGGKRRINLDPGYVSLAKLVLASTKDHSHRVYIGQGIYAEVTLHFVEGAFRAWPWTYPDYASPPYLTIFSEIRQLYAARLRLRQHKTQSGAK